MPLTSNRDSDWRVISHASELWTGAGIPRKRGRRIVDEDCGRIEDGAIVYSLKSRKIAWCGKTSEIPREFRKYPNKSLRKKHALVPGFVDCHTHLVFAGDRSEEFALRCGGMTYEEIAKRGGGIQTTVNATRSASKVDLVRAAIPRVREMVSFGVRTLEVKSGYGLDHEAEIKQLEVVKDLERRFQSVRFVATFLGAHAIPKHRDRIDYIREICEKTIPEVANRSLASSCDVFVDEGYFTIQEARLILNRAKEFGLKAKIHADELGTTGSTELAVEMGALSADHLLKISDEGIRRLSSSETVGVLLPGTALYLKVPYAPARKLIDSGACVALATDFNPGSCMCASLPAIMTLAALYMGMTRAEIFAAVTFNAAKALGLEQKIGLLVPGYEPVFSILPFERFEETYYRFAWAPPQVRYGTLK